MTDQELQEIEARIDEGTATREDIDKMTEYFMEFIKELEDENSNDRRQPRKGGVQKS